MENSTLGLTFFYFFSLIGLHGGLLKILAWFLLLLLYYVKSLVLDFYFLHEFAGLLSYLMDFNSVLNVKAVVGTFNFHEIVKTDGPFAALVKMLRMISI